MKVRRIDRRKVELPDRAIRALQLLAHLDRITPQEMLERLIVDFLELRWEDVSAVEQVVTPPPKGKPAKVIDLDDRRKSRIFEQALTIHNVVERSQALRAHSTRLCERSQRVRHQARQSMRNADRAWAHFIDETSNETREVG